VNTWNRLHAVIRRTYLGAWIFFVALGLIAVLSPGPTPLALRVVGGVLLVALCGAFPLLHVLEIHARRNMDPSARGGGPAVCGFCGRNQKQLDILMVGPDKYVCASCIREASALLKPVSAPSNGATLLCSFCGTQRPVSAVMLRDTAVICADCATLAAKHLAAAAGPVL